MFNWDEVRLRWLACCCIDGYGRVNQLLAFPSPEVVGREGL